MDVRGGDLRSGSTVCLRRREEPARGGAGLRIEPRHDCQDVPLFGAARRSKAPERPKLGLLVPVIDAILESDKTGFSNGCGSNTVLPAVIP